MRNGWGTWVCGIVLGAAAGFVCGHIAAWTRAESRALERRTEFRADVARSDPSVSDDAHDGPVYFPDRVAPPGSHNDDSGMMHADAVLETGGEPKPSATEPAELPAPADAAPLPNTNQQTLRAVLDTELADLSPADREIWLDALDGMLPADAVGVVRLWKRFGGGPGLLSETHHADSLPKTNAPSILLPTPTAPAPFSRGETLELGARPVRTNLFDARELVIHNLLNAETYGYRRVEPLFGIPAPTSPLAHVETGGAGTMVRPPTLQKITSRYDQTHGEFVETSSPLDLAIDGAGFFAVTAGDETHFTRCGRFSRDAAGRLVLVTSRGELPVSPALTIPEDCTAVTVSNDGDVMIQRDAGTPETIGTLSLALFVAPAQLDQRHDALFSATDRSGQPQFGRPNDGLRGGIVQRSLERSNVDVARETALLRQIDDWLELIDESAAAP